MAIPKVRGLEAQDELDPRQFYRDTRPLIVQFFNYLRNRTVLLSILLVLAILPIVYPGMIFISFILTIFCIILRLITTIHDRLLFRMPITSHKTDYSAPVPGRKSFFKAAGIFYLGNEMKSMQELWLSAKDCLTHMLVLGTTGAGKTETLVSIAFNALAMGSGFFYIDPKAAPKLGVQIYTMCRICGRDDDYRVINYSVRGKKPFTPNVISNTSNPFVTGQAEALTQLIVALIPQSEGDNAIFGQNAQTLITALMYALVELRDKEEIELSMASIGEYMTLQNVEKLARREDLSEATINALQSFLNSVGWQKDKPDDKQARSLDDQFGYARSYFALTLASLINTYGHIYNTFAGEVDMYDVIKNRRVMVAMLPSLDKSPQELQNIGRISLSSVRNAMAVGLGDKIEGTVEDTLESLPTDSPVPFLTITDEYAAIPTPGYVEVLTQGRGLGVAAVIASQDFSGIKKADELSAQQIIANTKIKLAMRTEDPDETWELFRKIAGESNLMQTSGAKIEEQSLSLSYQDQRSTSVVSVDRIHKRDLQEQIEGEFHAFFNSLVVRGRSFYANPPLLSNQQSRVNQMIVVPAIKHDDEQEIKTRLKKIKGLTNRLEGLIKNPDTTEITQDEELLSDLRNINYVFHHEYQLSRNDLAIISLMTWANKKFGKYLKMFTQKNKQAPRKEKAKEQTIKQSIENDIPDLSSKKDLESEKIEKQKSSSDTLENDDNLEDDSISFIPKPEKSSLDQVSQKISDKSNNYSDTNIAQGLNTIMETQNQLDFYSEGDTKENFQQDIKQIELKCGSTPEEAQQKAEQLSQEIESSSKIEYPQKPVPERLKKTQSKKIADYVTNNLTKLKNSNFLEEGTD